MKQMEIINNLITMHGQIIKENKFKNTFDNKVHIKQN